MKHLIFSLIVSVVTFAETWDGVERIVAVGDVHGSFDEFTTALRQAGVIDEKNKWSGGKTHLVQLGDVPDRAPDTRRIMDLLMELEKQAKKADGRVHALIGNHEAMNIYGDLRYAVPKEFAAFRTSSSEEIRSKFWDQHVEELRSKGAGSTVTPEYRQQWEKQYPEGFFEHRFEFNPNGKYGKWIRSHDAVIRINDTLFLHGGLSPAYASVTISEINKRVRRDLSELKLTEESMVIRSDGPLWYRGLATGPEAVLAAHVEALLQFHGVRRIVLGHTPTLGVPISRFGGKVILADVGLGKAYGGHLACLVIEKGEAVALYGGQRQPLSSGAVLQLAESGQ